MHYTHTHYHTHTTTHTLPHTRAHKHTHIHSRTQKEEPTHVYSYMKPADSASDRQALKGRGYPFKYDTIAHLETRLKSRRAVTSRAHTYAHT